VSRARHSAGASGSRPREDEDRVPLLRQGGGGRVAAVFPSRRRRAGVGLVLTTAPGHRTRGVHTGSSRAALLRAFPNRERLGSGFFLASARSQKLFWVSKGRVQFIALVSDRLLRRPPALSRAFRAALR
jgi:hypothetical protein